MKTTAVEEATEANIRKTSQTQVMSGILGTAATSNQLGTSPTHQYGIIITLLYIHVLKQY